MTSVRPLLLRLATVLACLTAAPAWSLDWTDNEVQLLTGQGFREPGNPQQITKSTVTLQHASGYSLGRNFAFLDILKSNNQERNLSGQAEAPTEYYGEAYTTLSLSKLGGTPFGFGPFKDFGLTAGINAGYKSHQLRSRPLVYLAGVTFDFAVPKGFFNVDVLAYRDHSCLAGISSCPNYRGTQQITPSWSVPFSVGSVDAEFTGFADFIGSRGAGTVRQVIAQPQLRVDIGKPLGSPGKVYAGIEYQYWRNKYGNDGVNEHVPQLLLLMKF